MNTSHIQNGNNGNATYLIFVADIRCSGFYKDVDLLSGSLHDDAVGAAGVNAGYLGYGLK